MMLRYSVGFWEPTRELLFVDDLVSAMIIIESNPKEEIINVVW